MKREWRVQRTTIVRYDANHRWDQVYQTLLRWSAREACDAGRDLCAGVNGAASC